MSSSGGMITGTNLLNTIDVFADFIVSGLSSPTSANLTSTLSSGAAYAIGTRVALPATANTYAASSDIYVDLNNAGILTYVTVANGAAVPAVTANSLRLQKVVTDATAVTAVTRVATLNPFTVIANGNVGVGTTSPGAKLSISEKLRLFDTTPPNASASTDAGYLFRTAIPAGFVTEVSGEILTFGINVPQVGTRDTARAGGLLRLDTRASDQKFVVFGYLTGSNDATERISVNLQNGKTVLVPTGGNVGIGLTAPTAALHIKAGSATADTAPIKFTSGPRNTTSVAGQIQYDGKVWFTNSDAIDRAVGHAPFAPATKTADYTVVVADDTLIFKGTASITLTLPAAADFSGRKLSVKNIAAFTVISASSNVVPLDTDVAGTAILAATAGKWATLQSNGTNWIFIAGN